MTKYNTVPVIIQQIVESMDDKNVHPNVKFNQSQVLEATKDYIESALKRYHKNR